MQNAIPNYLLSSSLFSTQELRIDDKNLKITTLSMKNVSKTIPLDLIDSEAKVSAAPNSQLLIFSFVCAVAGVLFFLSSVGADLYAPKSFASIFMLFSIGALITAFNKKSAIYTFFYENSTSPLFSLRESESSHHLVKTFVDELTQKVAESKRMSEEKLDDNEFTDRLDYLYNHDMVTDIAYQRIKNKINEKLHGIKTKEHLAEVIYLPVKKA